MQLGGVIIGIGGVLLFLWHLFRGASALDPGVGYSSHQVMSADSIILVLLGIIFFFLGRHRKRRKSLTTEGTDTKNGIK